LFFHDSLNFAVGFSVPVHYSFYSDIIFSSYQYRLVALLFNFNSNNKAVSLKTRYLFVFLPNLQNLFLQQDE
jgi:hypothetical protein